MNFEVAYIRHLLKSIQSTVDTPVVGNPEGGIVDMATVNYQAVLQQQFNSIDTGSSSAVLMNLPNSFMEPMNLYLSSILYANYLSVANAVNDNIFAAVAANGIYLPGLINPAHLRLSCHFEGTGIIPNAIVSADSPVWNSNLGAVAKWNINANNAVLSALNTAFVGGTPTSTSGTAANVFDTNDATNIGPISNSTAFAKYDFGAGNAQVLKSFYFHVFTSASGRYQISGSNDNTTWDILYTSGYYTNDAFITASTTNTTAYRYYRLSRIDAGDTFMYTFYGYTVDVAVIYNTSIHPFGTSSAGFNGACFLSGVASSATQLRLDSFDWHYRCFVNFLSAPNPMTLFTIAGKQLEILATATGLQIKYSTDGINFTTVNSSAITWDTDTFKFISIRRTGNTLYFYVDNVAYGTADLTGVTLFATATNAFYVGCDSANTNLFIGNMDELEFFVGESTTDTIPVAARATAYVPAINWSSIATYIKSGVSSIGILVFFDEVKYASFGVPIVGTDSHFYLSIDNGSTYHEVTLTKIANLTTALVSYSGSLTCTGLTNTNQLKYKIVSAAGKVIKFDGCIAYWN